MEYLGTENAGLFWGALAGTYLATSSIISAQMPTVCLVLYLLATGIVLVFARAFQNEYLLMVRKMFSVSIRVQIAWIDVDIDVANIDMKYAWLIALAGSTILFTTFLRSFYVFTMFLLSQSVIAILTIVAAIILGGTGYLQM